ncbi:dynein intermediate chain 2, putative [Babesia ovata]|uniref:Dynein intermediate chain 2, putative n=1 Tax=Babesia ovata TaxID=189622 RepID=A0A2H6KH38_9APIC|nr:dynein intermediate chain 2, putative [Babesia ovata]GBE62304.1 dynein intermediate chain 2, putative [Babesia ovata]
MTCGTPYGDLYVLDAFMPSYNRIDMGRIRRSVTGMAVGGLESRKEQSDMTCTASYRRSHHTAKQLTVERYSKLFKSGITCIEFHPRLPSLSAVGLDDGSVHLLFIEGENLVVKKTLRLLTFNQPVEQIEWLLVKGEKTEGKANARSTSFVDRIWRILSRAAYHSLLIGRANKHVKFVRVERNPRVFNFFSSVVEKPDRAEKDCDSKGMQPSNAQADRKAGKRQSNKMAESDEAVKCETDGELVLISVVKWPQPGYFEEELEYPTLTNFCLVQESLGVVTHHTNGVYMQIYTPTEVDSNIKFVKFEKQICLRIEGFPTAIQISPKQYNQMRRYLDTNNAHMFTLNGEKCLNALGEFIAIGSDNGSVYVTSMLHIYNRARASMIEATGKTNIANANNTDATENPSNTVTTTAQNQDAGCHSCDEEHKVADVTVCDRDDHSSLANGNENDRYYDVELASLNVGGALKCLRWGLIWNDYVRQPHLVAPDRCCCSDDIRFFLTAHTREHVEILQLAKRDGTLSLESSGLIDLQGSTVHWVEDTIPNDMTLMIATKNGLERFTWERPHRTSTQLSVVNELQTSI